MSREKVVKYAKKRIAVLSLFVYVMDVGVWKVDIYGLAGWLYGKLNKSWWIGSNSNKSFKWHDNMTKNKSNELVMMKEECRSYEGFCELLALSGLVACFWLPSSGYYNRDHILNRIYHWHECSPVPLNTCLLITT